MWNNIAERYHIWAEMNRWYYHLFAVAISHYSNPKLVIDICGGPGILGEEIKRLFPKVEIVCVDSSKKMCKISSGILGDAMDLPFKNDVFDLAILCFALHELNIDRAIDEAKRVLKRDGIIAIADLNSEVPIWFKLISENLLSFIIGLEYAESLSKKWKNFPCAEKITQILEERGFRIEFKRTLLDFWIIAKKI
ncbi:MAG: methyltransferase domain-containing protein [Archaeoglobaceae archaeon]|nr:methyltransferase domain-containing protein [Archaeoglobaceae archaeon]MDW7989596.1 methyltransferase domain-containing protein [Archaeoglobaceae archaeon]